MDNRQAQASSPRDASVVLAPRGGVRLKHGGVLPAVRVAATFYGRDIDEAPLVLVCHALTGSSRIDQWWGSVLGGGKLLDTDKYCIACTNVIGSCYGSTGPSSAATDGRPWGDRFPVVTVEDMVAVQAEALDMLGGHRLALVIGGSLGGQQALQWGAAFPDRVDSIVAIGATASLSPMGIALNSIAREAIKLDPARGIRIARMIGMLSYKSPALLWRRHGRRPDRAGGDPAASLWGKFDIEGYLQHQADKLAVRMDPASLLYLTKAMDLYELDASGWRVPSLFVGVEADWLYPPDEVEATARRLGHFGHFTLLRGDHGHDGFLADPVALTETVAAFLQQLEPSVA